MTDDMRRGSSLIAAGIGLSRLSGLVRDAALAFFLGANVGADAFRAALRIPNLLQNLLGEGVLSASFIPTYSRLLADGRDEDAGRLAGAVLGLLVVLTGGLVLLGVVFARPLTLALTPGFTGERLELTVQLVRLTFPGVGVLVLSAWCLGVLNSHRRFFLSYVAPVLWNVGILTGLLTLGATAVLQPPVAAGVGVVLGGLLQTAVQVPAVRRLVQPGFRLSLDRRSPPVRQVVTAFVPIVLGRGVVQLAALLDLVVASLLAVGAVAVLGYAQTLYLLPIALFGMSVAAAELPALSRLRHDARGEVLERLDDGLARSAFFVVGATVAYVLLGAPIVGVLFGRGEFDASTVVQVGFVVAVYGLALLPGTASRLLQSVLYATDDPRTPAVVAVIRVLAALAVGVPLMLNLDQLVVDLDASMGFRVADGGALPAWSTVDAALRDVDTNQLRLGAVGLAAGAVVGSWVEYWLLRRTLARRGLPARLGGGTLGQLLVAAAVAAAVMVAMRSLVGDGFVTTLLTAGLAGGAAYVLVCLGLRVPEAWGLFGRRPPGQAGPAGT